MFRIIQNWLKENPQPPADTRQLPKLDADEKRSMLGVAFMVLIMVGFHVVSIYAPNTWIQRDGRFYTNMNVTIVENFSLEQSQFASSWYNGKLGWNRYLPASFSNIAVGRNGEYWPMHPWLMPILSTPLFFAFGIFATLLFNVLLFGVIAASGYRFAREYSGPTSAAISVSILLLGTAVLYHSYDYNVDIMLLALFTTALVALITQRGLALGILMGLCLIVKPTCVLLLPGMLFLLWEKRDLRTLRWSLIGGSAVITVGAAVNIYLFGRPWWFGYNRVLFVENGIQKIESDYDAFSTPLVAGIRRMWSGYFGLSHSQTLIALGLPGLVSLVRHRWRYAVGALLTMLVSFFLFAKYNSEGHRFHWPAIAFLLPALGATFDLTGKLFVKLVQRIKKVNWSSRAAAFSAALLCVMAVVAMMPFGSPLTERVGNTAYVHGAMALGRHGSLDLRSVLGENSLKNRSSEKSLISQGQFGNWLPRSSPAAILIAAPFAALGGRIGIVFLHLVAVAVAVFFAVSILQRVAGISIVVVGVSAWFLMPWLRETGISGGPLILATALSMAALERALEKSWMLAGILGVLTAWVADAPWLTSLAVLILALPEGKRALGRASIGAAAVLILWGISHWILFGRPFGSPESFVLFQAENSMLVSSVGWGSSMAHLAGAMGEGLGRIVLLLLMLAPLGLDCCWTKNWRVTVAALVVTGSILIPGTLPRQGWAAVQHPLLVLMLMFPLAPLVSFTTEKCFHLARRYSKQGVWIGVGLMGVLSVVGTARKVALAQQPFRIGTEKSLRGAKVLLGDIPCDFIPWEHISWECSHLDKGHFNQVGLALPDGIHVGGKRVGMLLIPTGLQGQPRSVSWSGVSAGGTLVLDHAVPDGLNGNCEVVVSINEVELDRFNTSASADGRIQRRLLDTKRFSGEKIDLTIVIRPLEKPGAAVALAGEFQ